MALGIGYQKSEYSANYYNLKSATLSYAALLLLLSIVRQGVPTEVSVFGFKFEPEPLELVGPALCLTVAYYVVQFALAWWDEANNKLPAEGESLANTIEVLDAAHRNLGDAFAAIDKQQKDLLQHSADWKRLVGRLRDLPMEATARALQVVGAEHNPNLPVLRMMLSQGDMDEGTFRATFQAFAEEVKPKLEAALPEAVETLSGPIRTAADSIRDASKALEGSHERLRINAQAATDRIMKVRGVIVRGGSLRWFQHVFFDMGGVLVTASVAISAWFVDPLFWIWLRGLGH